MGKFFELVRDDVQSLVLTKHLKIKDEAYERAHFGNGLIVLAGLDFQIRISRDRGRFSVEIGATRSDTWWLLVDVCTLLKIRDLDFNAMGLDAEIHVIESNFSKLEELFAPRKIIETETQLRDIASTRTELLISRLGFKRKNKE